MTFWKLKTRGSSLALYWLELGAFNAMAPGSTPRWRPKKKSHKQHSVGVKKNLNKKWQVIYVPKSVRDKIKEILPES